MTLKIDMNSDLGEGFGRYTLGSDAEIMKCISSANIACGLHAGDPSVMRQSARRAKENGVGIGAHPGFPDLQGFGRRFMDMTPDEIEEFILFQLGALSAFAIAERTRVRHLKCHGALATKLHRLTQKDTELAQAVGRAVLKFDPKIIMVGFAGSVMVKVWREMGLKVADEIYADRAYNPDLTLVSRSIPGSVITDADVAVRRVLDMVKSRAITAMDGTVIKDVPMDTICIHGDTLTSLEQAKKLRKALDEEGIKVEPFSGR